MKQEFSSSSRHGHLKLGHTGNDFAKTQRTVKNGVTAIGLIYLLVALALTIVSVVLAVQVSGWFLIATFILGGYTLAAAVIVVIQRKLLKMSDW